MSQTLPCRLVANSIEVSAELKKFAKETLADLESQFSSWSIWSKQLEGKKLSLWLNSFLTNSDELLIFASHQRALWLREFHTTYQSDNPTLNQQRWRIAPIEDLPWFLDDCPPRIPAMVKESRSKIGVLVWCDESFSSQHDLGPLVQMLQRKYPNQEEMERRLQLITAPDGYFEPYQKLWKKASLPTGERLLALEDLCWLTTLMQANLKLVLNGLQAFLRSSFDQKEEALKGVWCLLSEQESNAYHLHLAKRERFLFADRFSIIEILFDSLPSGKILEKENELSIPLFFDDPPTLDTPYLRCHIERFDDYHFGYLYGLILWARQILKGH